MRPTAQTQSALRAPLNRLLGTEANVRILRVLAERDTALSASEIARRTQLRLSGVGKSVGAMVDAGILQPIGGGSRAPVQLRSEHPIAGALRELFRHEREYLDRVVDGLRAVAAGVEPLPQAVWIQGSVAKGDDRIGDPVVVGILAPGATLDRAREAFGTKVEPLEKELDIAIEVRVRSAADLEAMTPGELDELHDVIPLLGPPPLSLLSRDARVRPRSGGSRVRAHRDADEQTRVLAAALAERLRTDPSLVARARDYVAKRLTRASPGEQRELREWDHILRTMPVARLRRFLVDRGERATRLRQTLPFVGALTADERDQIVNAADRDTGGE